MDNCYTLTRSGLVLGISVTDGQIALGETGRGRTLAVVLPVGGQGNFPKGTVPLTEAGFRRDGKFTDRQDGDPCFIRVKTEAAYTRGAEGDVIPHGAIGVVARGNTAWGDAGRLGSHPDVIVAIRPGTGAVVAVFSGGRGKGGGARLLAWPTSRLAPLALDLYEAGDMSPAAQGLTPAEAQEILALVDSEKSPATAEALRVLAKPDTSRF